MSETPKSPPDPPATGPPSTATSPDNVRDATYRAKADVLNRAIRGIGMGRYQWQLFVGFNLTIGVTAVVGLVAAGSSSFGAACTFAALWSAGVGENLPVDSAIFFGVSARFASLFVDGLSIDWAFAQLLANLIAWPLLGRMTCAFEEGCTKVNNMGWRYFLIAMGGLAMVMFVVRFVFIIYESPKYLTGKGRNEQAVDVVHEVARRNGKSASFTQHELDDLDEGSLQDITATSIVLQRLEKVRMKHIRALVDTPKRGSLTTLIILVWAIIGLGLPLYNAFLSYIQESRGAKFGDGSTATTYRNSLIIAAMGIPGCLVGGLLVELPRFGRKGALSTSTVLTGAFLLASTTATTSDALPGWNCAFNFMSSLMYAVLYAYTPEIFLTKDRGMGNALTASANRIFGIMAPILAMFANLQTAIPVHVSGALFIAAGILVLLMPCESSGKASL